MKEAYNNGFPVPRLFLQLYGSANANRKADDLAAKVIAAIDPGVIQKIAADLGLSFVRIKEKESAVCFMNSEEVRPDFRLSFAPVDLYHYICAVLQDPSYKAYTEKMPDTQTLHIPYPKDAVGFWGMVKKGGLERPV
jgi:hypothetical protein